MGVEAHTGSQHDAANPSFAQESGGTPQVYYNSNNATPTMALPTNNYSLATDEAAPLNHYHNHRHSDATDEDHLLTNAEGGGAGGGKQLTGKASAFRWVVHIFVCLLPVAQCYLMDLPGAIGIGEHGTIQARFALHGKRYNQVMNQSLYSVFSWPNTVLAIGGGILIDRILGLRRATIVFAAFVCAGGWLFYLGVQFTQFPLMMVGRFVTGLGADSLGIAQSCFIARWFADGKGVALAFGVTITACRVGSTINFFFSPRIADTAGPNVATLIGACVGLISLAAAVLLTPLDRHGERAGMVTVWRRDAAGAQGSCTAKVAAIFRLPASSLLLAGVTGFVYSAVFPFIGIARDYFATSYGISGTEGSTLVAFYQLAAAVGSPIFGAIVDRTGFVIVWLVLSCTGFALVHLLFATTTAVSPLGMMVFMGAMYALLCATLWPSAPKTVDRSRVGLAYGVMASLQNILLAVVPLITGSVLDHYDSVPPGSNNTTAAAISYNGTVHHHHHHTHKHPSESRSSAGTAKATRQGYVYVEFLLLGIAVCAALFTLALWAVQVRIGGPLHVPAEETRVRAAAVAAGVPHTGVADYYAYMVTDDDNALPAERETA